MSAPRQSQPLSAVAWNNVPTGVGGGQSGANNSAVLRAYSCPFVSAFGSVNGACTMTLMYSTDGANWYNGPSTTLAGAGMFHLDTTSGAEFFALQSSANVTATAVISAK